MDASEELRELERLGRESPHSEEFARLQQSSKWGERIRQEVIERIKQSHSEAIEDGVRFLESNPRYFRSGYYKAAIASKLKSASLTEAQRARLRQVILDAAVSKDVGPEFSEYARLAVVVADAAFVAEISQQTQASATWVRRRFERVARLCRKHRPELT